MSNNQSQHKLITNQTNPDLPGRPASDTEKWAGKHNHKEHHAANDHQDAETLVPQQIDLDNLDMGLITTTKDSVFYNGTDIGSPPAPATKEKLMNHIALRFLSDLEESTSHLVANVMRRCGNPASIQLADIILQYPDQPIVVDHNDAWIMLPNPTDGLNLSINLHRY